MAAKAELSEVVNLIRKNIGSQESFTLLPKNKFSKESLQILQQEGFLHKKGTDIYATTALLNHIEALNKYIQAKTKDLENLAKSFIPVVAGRVFVSTKKGILEHETALRKNIGGAIFMFCY